MSGRAVDDNKNADTEFNSCTEMDEDDLAWWGVDLSRVYHITEVEITTAIIADRVEYGRTLTRTVDHWNQVTCTCHAHCCASENYRHCCRFMK